MEMTQCTEDVNSHATFLLASLNLQRTRAQFCDCVVRQKQSPAHLYPAHRCILAASSPVFASLLSTTGALVELQDPCFSDSVLVLVLDFIYTGALKPPIGHQQYCSLLTAACHLQMDQLEEALTAWHQTEIHPLNRNVFSGTENQLYTKTISTHGELVRTYSRTHNQPFSHSTEKLVETDACSGVGLNFLEKQDDRYSATVNTCGETERHSATLDSRIKLTERNTGSSSSINTSHCYSSKTKSRSTLSTANTCCSLAVSTVSSKNTSGCIRLHGLVQQDCLRTLPSTAEGQRTPRRQQSQSVSTVVPEKGQESREEALVRRVEERRGSSSPHIAEMQEEMRSRAERQICSLRRNKPEEVLGNREENDDEEEYSLISHRRRTQEELQDPPFFPMSTSLPPVCPSPDYHRDYASPSEHSSSSSSSSPLSCGVVPVICHSNRATTIQLAEVSALPPLYPASQTSASIIRTTIPQPASPGDGILHCIKNKDDTNIGASITSTDRDNYGAHNLGYRNDNKDSIGVHSWDYIHNNPKSSGIQKWNNSDHLDHCRRQNTCNTPGSDQYKMLKQDYTGCSTGHFGIHYDENDSMDDGLSQLTDYKAHLARCESLHSDSGMRHSRDDGISQSKDFPSGVDYRSDLDFDGCPSKQEQVDRSDCQDVSIATAEEERAITCLDQRLVSRKAETSLPVRRSGAGSDSLHGDRCCRGGNEKEDDHPIRCAAQMDRSDSCNPRGLKSETNNSYSSLHSADRNRPDAGRVDSHSSLHISSTDDRDTARGPPAALTDSEDHADVCVPASATPDSSLDDVMDSFSAYDQREREKALPEPHPSMEFENISDTEIAQPDASCITPGVSNTCDPTYNPVGHSYRGHLQYHCLSNELTHLTHVHSEDKHSHPSHLFHLHPADQFSDEEEIATCSSPGHSPLRQRYARGNGSQVVLLDISSKPAELLVSHRAGDEERRVSSGGGGRGNERERKQELDAGFGPGAGAKVGHQAGALAGGEPAKVEGAGMSTSLPACVSPSAPDGMTASMSSPLPVNMPSAVSVCTPSSVPAHLSALVHQPYQCSLCDRSFSQRGSLNRHMRSHLGVRPYSCPRCPMTFSRQYRVTEHMRVHQRFALGEQLQKPPASSI